MATVTQFEYLTEPHGGRKLRTHSEIARFGRLLRNYLERRFKALFAKRNDPGRHH